MSRYLEVVLLKWQWLTQYAQPVATIACMVHLQLHLRCCSISLTCTEAVRQAICATLARSATLPVADTLGLLRGAHAAGKHTTGIAVMEGTVSDMQASNVWEPVASKALQVAAS